MSHKLYTPRPFQPMMSDHILDNPRCALWAGMGMGKSVTTLSAVQIVQMVEPGLTLVLGPLRVAEDTWPSEAMKWTHLRQMGVVPIVGTERQRRDALRIDAPVHTTNYEQLVWLTEYWGDRWPYTTVISDESDRLKSFRLKQGGRRAQALGRVAHTKVRRFIELSGTPSPNGLKDLWGQIWFLDAGKRLGRTHQAFKDRWFRDSPDGYGLIPLPFAQEQIQDLLRDICLTVEAKDWFDIKEPIVNNIYVKLPRDARARYREMEKEMFTSVDSHDVEAFGAAARTMKCLQIANGAVYVGEDTKEWRVLHDAKLQALESVVSELAGAPALVAYHFKSDLARLMKAFPGALNVGTSEGLAAAKAGKGTVWLGHPASMGHGVDGLQQHCNTLVYFGHWWDLGQRMQILERIGPTRQIQAGFDRPVFVHNIIAEGTVDEMVIERTESKRSVQEILMEAMKRRV